VQAATLDGLPRREIGLRLAGAAAVFVAGAAPLAPLASMLLIVAVVGGLAAAGRLSRAPAQR
jgi:hypothetical protein